LGATVPPVLVPQLSQQLSHLFRWNMPQRRSFRLCLQQLSQVLQHLGAGQQVVLQQVGAGLQQGVGQAGGAQQLLRWNRPPLRPPHAGGQAGAQVLQLWWQR
jgi:hypothetical protein